MKKINHQKVITKMQIFLNKEVRTYMVLNQFMKERNRSDYFIKSNSQFPEKYGKTENVLVVCVK